MGSTLNKIRYFVVKLDVLIENFLDSMIRITKNTKNFESNIPTAYASGEVFTVKCVPLKTNIKIPPKSNSEDIFITEIEIAIIIFTYCFELYS